MSGKARRPFAATLHLALVVAMLVSFLLIAQQWSKVVFQAGLGLLVASALVQVVFGNVSPEAGFGRSMKQLALGLLIVAAVFGLGIVLTPALVNLGR
jgi:hypothetical protein